MTDAQLMAEIRDEWGATIGVACQASSVPPAFLAALVANESGGDPNASRFEPGVLAAIWQVLLGRKATYGSIGRDDLLLYVLPGSVPAISGDPAAVAALFSGAFKRVGDLATSWGLTQVMGYHVLEETAGVTLTEDLAIFSKALPATLRLLSQFAQRFGLDLTKDFRELLTCWNTGEPNGKTADPDYVDKGIRRMGIYAQFEPAAGVAS